LGRFMQRDPLGYVDGMGVYSYYAGMRGGVDPSGMIGIDTIRRRQESIDRNGRYEGEKRFDSHIYTASNGNKVQVFYVYTAIWQHGVTTRVVRGQQRTTRWSRPAGLVPTSTFAFSYCPGFDEDRERDIEKFGKSLASGVDQDNSLRGQRGLVQGLTFALHSVPFGASSDHVSKGEYGEAVKAGMLDTALLALPVRPLKAAVPVNGAAKGSRATGSGGEARQPP